MGIYDRDYYRQQQPGYSLQGPRTIIGKLILINVIIYLVDWLVMGGAISRLLAVRVSSVEAGTLEQPWLWWQWLTYGFVHSEEPTHVGFNMFGLWMLGRHVESRYGQREFLRLYLAMLFVGGLIWSLSNTLMMQGGEANSEVHLMLIGASGAVCGVVVLFALNFPHQTLLLMFVLPVPAWFLGVLLVGTDLMRALRAADGDNVAYGVHLAGAAFAFLYFRLGWNLTRWTPNWPSPGWLKPRPRLRLHDPEDGDQGNAPMSEEVDRILEKIHSQGEGSLTRKERRTLENASRQYQKKRRGPEDSK